MPRTSLLDTQQEKAKVLFYCICHAANINRNGKIYDSMNSSLINWFDRYASKESDVIINSFKTREITFNALQEFNNAIKSLATKTYRGCPLTKSIDNWSVVYEPKSEVLMRYIAWICANRSWWWDDSNVSRYEREQLEKIPIFTILSDFNCFVSQQQTAQRAQTSASTAKATTAKKDTTAATTNATTATNTNGPKNNYKSLGKLSPYVKTLITRNKTVISSIMFCIEADKTGANKRTLFVTPLTADGREVSVDAAKKVKLGSGNGYSDCQLWWDTLQAAQVALNKISSILPKENFQIKKAKPDPNGYFTVMTDLGGCWIKASKLNEALEEELELELDECNNKASNSYSIKDIDVFSEAFDKYGD